MKNSFRAYGGSKEAGYLFCSVQDFFFGKDGAACKGMLQGGEFRKQRNKMQAL